MIKKINRVNSLTDKKLITNKLKSAQSLIFNASETNRKDGALLLMKALDTYIEVIDADPENIEAHHGLAFVSYAFEESERALNFLAKALGIDPLNKDTIKMYSEVKNNIKNGITSTIISKYASKSLEQSSKPEIKSLNIAANLTNKVANKIIKGNSMVGGNDFFSLLQSAKSKK